MREFINIINEAEKIETKPMISEDTSQNFVYFSKEDLTTIQSLLEKAIQESTGLDNTVELIKDGLEHIEKKLTDNKGVENIEFLKDLYVLMMNDLTTAVKLYKEQKPNYDNSSLKKAFDLLSTKNKSLKETSINNPPTKTKYMSLSEYIQQQDIPEERKMKLVEMSRNTSGIQKTQMVSKENINVGDTVFWDGKWKTLGKNDVKRDKFMGTSVFGDASPEKVERALFPKYKGNDVNWQARI